MLVVLLVLIGTSPETIADRSLVHHKITRQVDSRFKRSHQAQRGVRECLPAYVRRLHSNDFFLNGLSM